MYIRKKRNKSGSISVQIIDTSGGCDRLLKTIGCTKEPEKIKGLIDQAYSYISKNNHQGQLVFEHYEDINFLSSLNSGLKNIQMIGPELILGKIFDQIGFNKITDQLFRHLVISRLVFPLSKLKTSEYLMRYQNVSIDADRIYRYLDKLESRQKKIVQQISFNHTLQLFDGHLSIVFYDVTTLYFESSNEDELRKTGYSKDGKHQCPQIVLGLLVSIDGYPLAYEIFEGNKFEGHTMLPVIEDFKKEYSLGKLLIIADAGLLSKKNIAQLIDNGYEFILGGRIKNESEKIKQEILSHQLKDGQSLVINPEDKISLIVGYSTSRASKDAHNRKRGLKKLEQALEKKKLTKQHINNRGYNKYLRMDGEITLSIDYEKFKADGCWDGLKGYLTNSKLDKQKVIENYKQLWQIEKAFRISKTDLRVRPIYHRLPKRIAAHLIIAFCAYKLYKELERQLKIKNSSLSPAKAMEIMKTIYQVQVVLPKSQKEANILFAHQEEQIQLLKLFNISQPTN
jgi:transposase